MAITLANCEVQEVVMQSVNLKHGKYSWYAIDTFYNYHYNVIIIVTVALLYRYRLNWHKHFTIGTLQNKGDKINMKIC